MTRAEEIVAAIPLHWNRSESPAYVSPDLLRNAEEVVKAIEAAVVEERERCAVLLEEAAAEHQFPVIAWIVAKIRDGKRPSQKT